mmetsp:Transcript_91661/g.256150  ORF Transcript_91661/g.256150 Transcript_91661/m.256150 type:complete len:146 (-) Transcript_91661:294-731(-)
MQVSLSSLAYNWQLSGHGVSSLLVAFAASGRSHLDWPSSTSSSVVVVVVLVCALVDVVVVVPSPVVVVVVWPLLVVVVVFASRVVVEVSPAVVVVVLPSLVVVLAAEVDVEVLSLEDVLAAVVVDKSSPPTPTDRPSTLRRNPTP